MRFLSFLDAKFLPKVTNDNLHPCWLSVNNFWASHIHLTAQVLTLKTQPVYASTESGEVYVYCPVIASQSS